jgi:hypothetical protein
VLAVGNYMNEGTNRGNCPGFELQFLLAVRDVKVTEATTDIKNLLQLLVDISARADANGIVTQLDCPHVQQATRVAVKHLVSQLKVLDQGVKQVVAEVDTLVAAAADSETRFGLVMKVFSNTAQSDIKLLHAAVDEMNEKLEQVGTVRAEKRSGEAEVHSRSAGLSSLVLALLACVCVHVLCMFGCVYAPVRTAGRKRGAPFC